MKNRIFGFAALIMAAVIFAGCPYSSEVPLSAAGIKVPSGLVGTWEDADNPDDKVEVKAGSDNKVQVIHTTTSEGSEPTVENYTGHFTDVNGTLFLNLMEDSEYASGYYLYKIDREGDNKIHLLSVTPNIRETFDNSDAMKKFFAENMKNSYFYESTETTYFKIK